MSASMRDRLQAGGDIDPGDYLSFRIGAPTKDLTNAPRGGARYPCEAVLVGKTCARFHIDIGVGDAVVDLPTLSPATTYSTSREFLRESLRHPQGAAVRREASRLHVSVGRPAKHSIEGPRRSRAPHRTRVPDAGGSARHCPQPSARGDALAPENAALATRFVGSGFQGHGRGSEYLHRRRSAGVCCPRTVLGRDRVRTGANMMPAPIAIQLCIHGSQNRFTLLAELFSG